MPPAPRQAMEPGSAKHASWTSLGSIARPLEAPSGPEAVGARMSTQDIQTAAGSTAWDISRAEPLRLSPAAGCLTPAPEPRPHCWTGWNASIWEEADSFQE